MATKLSNDYPRLLSLVSAVLYPSMQNDASLAIELLLKAAIEWMKDYPNATVDPVVWEQLKHLAGTQLDTALTHRLHQLHSHPDFVYTCVQTGRKQELSSPPKGVGWTENAYLIGDVLIYEKDRDDYTDTYWYRRLKSDEALDVVDPFDYTRIIALEPVTLFQVLECIAKKTNSSYFPIPSLPSEEEFLFHRNELEAFIEKMKTLTRPEYNSKPHYIEHGSFFNQLEEEYNVYSPDLSFHPAFDPDCSVFLHYDKTVFYAPDPKAVFYYFTSTEADVLINLSLPFTQSFVRVDLKGGGKRGPFVPWSPLTKLALNLYETTLADEILKVRTV